MVNRSMNQVLMRSINTSFVALLPVASLLVVGSGILGAVTLRDFALALFVGLLVGAYSSIFVATPLLAWLKEREPRYAALRERAARTRHEARPRDPPWRRPRPTPHRRMRVRTRSSRVTSSTAEHHRPRGPPRRSRRATAPSRRARVASAAASGADVSLLAPRMVGEMSSIDLRPERRSGIPRPWRRHHIDDELAPLLAEYQQRHRRADTTLIEIAFEGRAPGARGAGPSLR